MIEPHRVALLPRRQFLRRMASHAVLPMSIALVWLGVGVAGYHVCAGLPLLDAFLNASMILSGMGPVDPLRATAAKVFAGVYALFSGAVFLSTVGIFLTPIATRMLHRFHLEADEHARAADGGTLRAGG